MKFLFSLLIGLVSLTPLLAQDYALHVQVKGYTGDTAILGYYYGNKKLVKDSAAIDSKGWMHFTGEGKIPSGIYMVVLPGEPQQFFEFIPDQPEMTLTTTRESLIGDMKIEGSPESAIFYEYLQYVESRGKKLDKLMPQFKAATGAEKEQLEEEINALREEINSKKRAIMKEHPGSFVAKLFQGMQDPEVPEPPLTADGKADSTFKYRYYKAHFWDNVDLTDDRLLRSPVYHPKLEQYITRVTLQHPDSIINEADWLLNQVKDNEEMFKYTLFWLTNHYEQSKLMIAENVFAHLAVNYWGNEEYNTSWVDDVTKAKIVDKGRKITPSLVGKTAPNLKLPDTNNVLQELHAIDTRFTVLYFWDSTCGVCKKVTPKLKELYDKYKGDILEVYAVNTEFEAQSFKQYIRENELDWINVSDIINQSRFRQIYDIKATPVILVLDENKKIIAKKVEVETIEKILTGELKF